jgi:hypothetical protein
MASPPDDRIDLARGALLIAKAAYPDLIESFYLGRLNLYSRRSDRPNYGQDGRRRYHNQNKPHSV